MNGSGETYVAWNWKESATAGFDIVGYNGDEDDTISHGLGVSPEMMLIKSRESANDWMVWHVTITNANNKVMNLNNADGVGASGSNTFIKAVSSSTFTLGSSAFIQDGSSNDYIAYLFSSVSGYSKVGTYIGSGNANGPFVYTGFKPAWVMLKITSTNGYNWLVFDNKRIGYNQENHMLLPNETHEEKTSGYGEIDILSNGFKLRSSENDGNKSGETMLYLAFAETPFKYANAR